MRLRAVRNVAFSSFQRKQTEIEEEEQRVDIWKYTQNFWDFNWYIKAYMCTVQATCFYEMRVDERNSSIIITLQLAFNTFDSLFKRENMYSLHFIAIFDPSRHPFFNWHSKRTHKLYYFINYRFPTKYRYCRLFCLLFQS